MLPKGYTTVQFWDWCCLPENEDRAFELDRGSVTDRPYPGYAEHGLVCGLVNRRASTYLRLRGRGYGLSNNVGFWIERDPDTVFCPDFAMYLNNPKRPLSDRFATELPDLVVEVLDERDVRSQMPSRAHRFLNAGAGLVWIVDIEVRSVAVYHSSDVPDVLMSTDELTGNGVLPDFRCRVADLFSLPGQQPLTP